MSHVALYRVSSAVINMHLQNPDLSISGFAAYVTSCGFCPGQVRVNGRWCNKVQHGAVQYSTMRYSPVQYSTV